MADMKASQLVHLSRVYRLRMQRIKPHLMAKVAERNNVDKLIDLLKADMKMVASQRKDWEASWQQWLLEGGSLNNGRSFSAHHLQLTEIENLLLHHEANMNKKRADIQKKIDDIKRVMIRFQEKIRFIEDKLIQLRKQADLGKNRQESQQYEEVSLANWYAQKQETQDTKTSEIH